MQNKRREMLNRTTRQRIKLYLIRAAINILVIVILGGSIYAIYFTTDLLLKVFFFESFDTFMNGCKIFPQCFCAAIEYLNFQLEDFFENQ